MRRLILFILTLHLLTFCSQEVENPIAEYCWPVVHCLLDADDSIHYLRLGKTFSGSDVDEMIHNRDSLYFSDAKVHFDIYEDDFIIETIQLEEDETLERDPGILPLNPFVLYRTDCDIRPGKIGLRIEIPEINKYVIGSIFVRGKPNFYAPLEGSMTLDLDEDDGAQIGWNGYKLVSETTVRLWYLEFTDNEKDTCHLDWTRYAHKFRLMPNDYFNFIDYSIKQDNQVKGRQVLWVDILASGGNFQWFLYLDQKDVVFDLIGKPYSNITGAYGFVGSRASGGLYRYSLNSEFLESLANLPSLSHLKFIQ